MSNKPHERFNCAEGCSVEATLSIIGGKYKGTIIYRLFTDDVLRFNEIRRILPEVTQKTLTTQLRALEEDGIIEREIYPEIPPKVEYRLTNYGQTLKPIILAMKQWGDSHQQALLLNH